MVGDTTPANNQFSGFFVAKIIVILSVVLTKSSFGRGFKNKGFTMGGQMERYKDVYIYMLVRRYKNSHLLWGKFLIVQYFGSILVIVPKSCNLLARQCKMTKIWQTVWSQKNCPKCGMLPVKIWKNIPAKKSGNRSGEKTQKRHVCVPPQRVGLQRLSLAGNSGSLLNGIFLQIKLFFWRKKSNSWVQKNPLACLWAPSIGISINILTATQERGVVSPEAESRAKCNCYVPSPKRVHGLQMPPPALLEQGIDLGGANHTTSFGIYWRFLIVLKPTKRA